MAVLTLTAYAVDSQICRIDWDIQQIVVSACLWAAVASVPYDSLPSSNYSSYLYSHQATIYGSGSNGYASGSFYIQKVDHSFAFTGYGVARSISNDQFYSAGGGQTIAPAYSPPPTIELYQRGTDYISVRIEGFNTAYSNGGRLIDWYFDSSSSPVAQDYLADGNANSAPRTFSGLNPATTHTVGARVWYKTVSGGSYDASVALTDEIFSTLAPTRPTNFSWSTSKTSGGAFNLTSTQWNNFTTKINEFRTYKGMPNTSFTTAYLGSSFSAAIYNQARTSIGQISGAGTLPAQGYTGSLIYASYLNDLVSALNAIP